MKVLMVGTYPPPYGGISVHIERLFWFLNSSKNIECSVLDTSGFNSHCKIQENIMTVKGNKLVRFLKIIEIIKSYKGNLIHYQVSAMGNFAFGGFMFTSVNREAKHIITIHSGNFTKKYLKSNAFMKRITKKTLERMDYIITVNEEQKIFIENTLGIRGNVRTIPAFIHPSYEDDLQIKQELQQMEGKYKSILVVSGSIYRYYGFHFVVDAVKKMVNANEIGVIFVFYSGRDVNYENEIINMIRDSENVKVYRDLTPAQYCTVLKSSDIFIRPTDRDGDSVSIREAGYFGKQIVASDCVRRPNGSILFKTDDINSLVVALTEALTDKHKGVLELDRQNNESEIEKTYNYILKNY